MGPNNTVVTTNPNSQNKGQKKARQEGVQQTQKRGWLPVGVIGIVWWIAAVSLVKVKKHWAWAEPGKHEDKRWPQKNQEEVLLQTGV